MWTQRLSMCVHPITPVTKISKSARVWGTAFTAWLAVLSAGCEIGVVQLEKLDVVDRAFGGMTTSVTELDADGVMNPNTFVRLNFSTSPAAGVQVSLTTTIGAFSAAKDAPNSINVTTTGAVGQLVPFFPGRQSGIAVITASVGDEGSATTEVELKTVGPNVIDLSADNFYLSPQKSSEELRVTPLRSVGFPSVGEKITIATCCQATESSSYTSCKHLIRATSYLEINDQPENFQATTIALTAAGVAAINALSEGVSQLTTVDVYAHSPEEKLSCTELRAAVANSQPGVTSVQTFVLQK